MEFLILNDKALQAASDAVTAVVYGPVPSEPMDTATSRAAVAAYLAALTVTTVEELDSLPEDSIIRDLERETTELKQRLNLALDPHAELEILESE